MGLHNPIRFAKDIIFDGSETVEQILDDTINAGILDAITITDTGTLGISWTVGEIWDHVNSTVIDTDAGSGNCTDNTENYLIWTTGTTLTLGTTQADPASDEILVATIYCQANDIWEISSADISSKRTYEMSEALSQMFPAIVASGIIISEDTDITNVWDVSLSAGTYYLRGHDRHTIAAAVLSRTVNMVRWYHVAGAWASDTNAEIDITQWDNPDGGGPGVQALSAIAGGGLVKYYRSSFFVVGSTIHWVYPQVQYNTIAGAQDGGCPVYPPGLDELVASTCLILQGNDAAFPAAGTDNWIDIRPTIGSSPGASTANHANLQNLTWSASGHTIDANVNMEGNTIYGDSAANGDLTFESTSSATKGQISFNDMTEVRLTSNAPRLSFYDSDGAADTKWWDMYINSTSMKFRVINDAGSDASTPFEITRSGYATTDVTFNPDGADQDFIINGDALDNLFFVDAGNDKIGAGTNVPDYHFHSVKANGLAGLFEKTSAGTDNLTGAAMFKHTTSGDMINEFGAGISFAIQDSADVENIIGRIGFERSGADDAGDFVVETIPTGGALTEYFRVTDLGLTGIRTPDPVAPLEISDGGTTAGMVAKITQDDANVIGIVIGNDTSSATDTDGLSLSVDDGGSARVMVVGGDTDLQLGVGVTPKIEVSAAGVRIIPNEVTIAGGAISISRGYHHVDTQAEAASDNLDTISNGQQGQLLWIIPESGARTVVVRDASVSGGNIQTTASGSFTMNGKYDCMLLLNEDNTSWVEVSRSPN